MARFIASVSRLGVMPGRQTFSGLRWMVVSIMLNGAGSVAVSARPTLGAEPRERGGGRAQRRQRHRAVNLVVPEEIARELGLRHRRTRTVVYADEGREERPVGLVTIEIGNRRGIQRRALLAV